MSEDNVTPIKPPELEEAFRHKFGIMLFGAIVGFMAKQGAEKLYKVALEAYRSRD